MNIPPKSGMAALTSRHFLFSWDLIVPFLLLVFGTILFRSTNLDILIQNKYFTPPNEWAFNRMPIPRLIYHYGNIPALIVSIGGLLLFIFSFSKAAILRFRLIGSYLVLAMIIGPGLIANTILKDNWGRPRPREIVNFGGNYAYEEPLSIDTSSPGKSFPCGHATTGFYFFALALVLRKWRPRLANGVLLFAVVWGTVIGWIRIGMGGHFASDVLWAGGLVYLSSYAIYRLMGMDKMLFYAPSDIRHYKPLKLHHKVMLWSLGILIICGVMLATPYSSKRNYQIGNELVNSTVQHVSLDMEIGNVKVMLSDKSVFSYQNNGFGFPGSKLKSRPEFTEGVFSFKQWQKGLFTEISSDAVLLADSLRLTDLQISIKKGIVEIPAGYTDTLFVSSEISLDSPKFKGTIVRMNHKPVRGWWIDAPKLIIK